MDKMADTSTVVFSGSSTETIENAKAFWMAVDPPFKPKSTLVVSGINHRLLTAPAVENAKKLNDASQKFTEKESNPRLKRHLEDAQQRKDREEEEYVNKMEQKGQPEADVDLYFIFKRSFREDAQQTLAQRKTERLKKDEISHRRLRGPILDISDSSEEDEEAAEAMAELDRFEESLKQKEALKSDRI